MSSDWRPPVCLIRSVFLRDAFNTSAYFSPKSFVFSYISVHEWTIHCESFSQTKRGASGISPGSSMFHEGEISFTSTALILISFVEYKYGCLWTDVVDFALVRRLHRLACGLLRVHCSVFQRDYTRQTDFGPPMQCAAHSWFRPRSRIVKLDTGLMGLIWQWRLPRRHYQKPVAFGETICLVNSACQLITGSSFCAFLVIAYIRSGWLLISRLNELMYDFTPFAFPRLLW